MVDEIQQTTPQPDQGTKLAPFSPEHAEKLISGKTTTDSLANVYARVSMSVETKRPGAFARLSEEYYRAGYSTPGMGQGLHAARVAQRAGSKGSSPGWIALIQQVNRIARMNLRTSPAVRRAQQNSRAQWTPAGQWSQRVAAAVSGAEQFIDSQTTATQQRATECRYC